MKRLIILLLFCCLLFCALHASAAGERASNWYEIFVRSFQDSDGDGIGDLNGVSQRLDYLEQMGYDGIWLMPIMPSPSYHKYDVTDYYSVDPEYGSIDDFRRLTEACHSRGMQIILDMPVNHTSVQHPWFLSASEAVCSGSSDGTGFYCFRPDAASGWTALADTGWYYEERFAGGGMPDLNLDNEALREELTAIFDFWLNSCGADGFRLDAVTSYYTGREDQNIAFLHWIKETCEQLKPGCYLVGECWAGLNTIASYYQSGIDSFFLFPASQAEGFIAASMRARRSGAEKLASSLRQLNEMIPNGLLAPFLSNHDTGRTIGAVQGRSSPKKAKFAEGLLGMMRGCVFTYYGEEIGMAGSASDPDKRLAMYWSEEDMTQQPPGASVFEYPYPPVCEQLSDPSSLLQYCKKLNHLRLEHPAIAFGHDDRISSAGDLCLIQRSTADEAILICANFSKEKSSCAIPSGSTLICSLDTGEETAAIARNGKRQSLVLPAYSIAVFSLN